MKKSVIGLRLKWLAWLWCWVLLGQQGFINNVWADAKADASLEAQIQAKISELHPSDTPEWWAGLGAEAPRVIIGMHQKTKKTVEKIRLLQALGWFSDPAGLDYLKAQTQEATNETVRSAGIRTIGFSQGIKEFDFIQKYLNHPEARTRVTAVKVLQEIYQKSQDPRVKDSLERWRKDEKAAWVIERADGPLPKQGVGGVGAWAPVSSSDQNEKPMSDRLLGAWKGVATWVVNSSDPAVQTVDVRVEIKDSGTGGKRGKVVFDLARARSVPGLNGKNIEISNLNLVAIPQSARLKLEGVYEGVSGAPSLAKTQKVSGWFKESPRVGVPLGASPGKNQKLNPLLRMTLFIEIEELDFNLMLSRDSQN